MNAKRRTLRSSEPSTDEYLPARRTWERYGVTSMSLLRWLKDPKLQFPQPYYFGRHRFFKLAELEAWERAQPRRRKAA